jgi:hypothetical protein
MAADDDAELKSPISSPASPRAPSALSTVLSHFETDTPSIMIDRSIPPVDPSLIVAGSRTQHDVDPRLPPNLEQNAWLFIAANDAFNNVNTIWTALSSVCTEDSCSQMEAGKV